MGEGGRDGIPRERCGGGEGELNVSTVREKRASKTHRRKRNRGSTCGAEDTHHRSYYLNDINAKYKR